MGKGEAFQVSKILRRYTEHQGNRDNRKLETHVAKAGGFNPFTRFE